MSYGEFSRRDVLKVSRQDSTAISKIATRPVDRTYLDVFKNFISSLLRNGIVPLRCIRSQRIVAFSSTTFVANSCGSVSSTSGRRIFHQRELYISVEDFSR